MTKSMTGYGLAQGKIRDRGISVECKSVNHKYCEVNVRVPPRFAILEGKILEYAKSFFNRGRIDIFIREDSQNGAAREAKIDLAQLKTYYRELKKAAKEMGLSPQIGLDTLLTLPQVIQTEDEEAFEKVWRTLKVLLRRSFEALEKMRLKEGKTIFKFLSTELNSLLRLIKMVEKIVPKNVQHYKHLLEERIQKLSTSAEVDPQRLAQEVAYFVDRTDISEELQRLKAHGDHFKDILITKTPFGRKLDFLLQEMNREVNTLSSKAQNAVISQHVVDCKHTLERMREQVQNVE